MKRQLQTLQELYITVLNVASSNSALETTRRSACIRNIFVCANICWKIPMGIPQ